MFCYKVYSSLTHVGMLDTRLEIGVSKYIFSFRELPMMIVPLSFLVHVRENHNIDSEIDFYPETVIIIDPIIF